jgi:hypothetical protein
MSVWTHSQIALDHSADWLAWESFVHIAVFINCLNSQYNGIDFNIGYHRISHAGDNPMVSVFDIPSDLSNLKESFDFFKISTSNCVYPSLIYFIPKNPQLETIDSVLCFKKSSNEIDMYGIQMKLERSVASIHLIPNWISHLFIVRGDTATKPHTTRDNWTYLSEVDVKNLL